MTADELRAWIAGRRRLAEAATPDLKSRNASLYSSEGGDWIADFALMGDADFAADARTALPIALDHIEALLRENHGRLREGFEAEQALGKALGYPVLDHTVCPRCDKELGCTCGDPQVCVGEHTLVSLAVEAARRITKLLAELESAQHMHAMERALGDGAELLMKAEDIERAHDAPAIRAAVQLAAHFVVEAQVHRDADEKFVYARDFAEELGLIKPDDTPDALGNTVLALAEGMEAEDVHPHDD